MLKYLLTIAFSYLVMQSSNSQPTHPVKYRDLIYSSVTVTYDLYYHTPTSDTAKRSYYKFDFYEPPFDTSAKRPLIIWMHGGGFVFGSKNASGPELWSKTFAQRGYVCASINYTLNRKNTFTNFENLVQGCSSAVDDVTYAIQYFKQNAAKFRIDTNCIILAGNSAGGMIALQAAYSNQADMAKLSHQPDRNNTSSGYNPQNIAAVINFWGAIYDINWLKNAKVPIVSVHGRMDRTVPIGHLNSPFYGSAAIHQMADTLQIPNSFKVYGEYAHELQVKFNPLFAGSATKQRWLEAGQFAADFLYETLFKPRTGE